MAAGPSHSIDTGSDDAVDKWGGTQPCASCDTAILKGVAYISLESIAHDWQGRLPVICQECFKGRPDAEKHILKEWKKLCKAAGRRTPSSAARASAV